MKRSKSVKEILKIADLYEGDTEKQKKELKKRISEGRKTGDLYSVGAAYCCLSEVCDDADDIQGMLVNSLKAVTILKEGDDYELIARAYSILGKAYTNQGNNQLALSCDVIANRLIKKHRIKGRIRIKALNNLAVSYRVMEEPRESIRLLTECVGLIKKEYPEEYTDLLMYSLNLAECNKDVGELKRAEEILESVSEVLGKVDYQPLVCDFYLRRAIVAYLLGDAVRAGGYMDTAFEIFPDNMYPLPLYDDLCEVAPFVTKNKDRTRAEKILDLMTVYSEKNKGTFEQLFAARVMANFYKEFGEYRLATGYYSRCEELNERQMRELKEMQLELHSATLSTEAEIQKLKRRMRESEELLSREPMTKLLNRSALLRISEEFIAGAAKKKQKVGAVFIDIDCFKECNDTYGHAKGDEIIREIARICRKQETKDVRFARYGGDEFFGIAKGLGDGEVCEIARRICRAVQSAAIPNEKNPNGGILTLSVGVVNVPITGKTDTILEIANYADKALYFAKNAGRNAIYELVHGGEGNDTAVSAYIKIDF